MKNGLKPLKHDHRDFDFIKTKRFSGAIMAFPEELTVDAHLWMPDQNADGQPYGCTNYTSADLLSNEDGHLYDPKAIEAVSHANANGGTDLRTAAKAVISLYGKDHPNYLWVNPDIPDGGYVDWFDAIRLAITVGIAERRAVSVGSAWHEGFERVGRDGLITDDMLTTPITGGHDWAAEGWVKKDEPRLICKSWQGVGYGDGGYVYFTRAQFNKLMGTATFGAFVYDKLLPGETPIPISSTTKQWLVSFFTNLFRKLGL